MGSIPLLDLANCPCTGVTLDRLIQPAILTVLAEGPLHGYRLAERIAEMPTFSGQKPDVSGIYRFLKTMEQKGLVVSTWDVSESGPARKSYEITSEGKRCLQQWIKTLEAYRRGIAELLRGARKTLHQRHES
ncbi:MAG: PadR family transcriptional regulator [Thermoguttaceae bacterium]|jgi:DNA-binding PadR family transcriptional regulator